MSNIARTIRRSDLRHFAPTLILAAGLALLGPSLSALRADQADVLPLGNRKLCYAVASLEAGGIMEAASEKLVSIGNIVAANMDRDLFIIGEIHDSYECHEFQRDFIEALASKNDKIVIGFEFFQREDDEALELWRTGKIDEKALLERVGWYEGSSQNYGFTRLIMDVVRKHALKTIGLNVPRAIIHKVSTGGFKSLSAEEQALFPGVSVPNPEHEFYIRTIFGETATLMPGWFANMYEAQKCWDVIMAESMRKVLARKEFKGWKGVIIAGSGHVSYGLGIPFRYSRAAGKVRSLTIVPVPASAGGGMMPMGNVPMPMSGKPAMGMGGTPAAAAPAASAVFTRSIGDYVLAVSPTDKDHFPNFGFSGRMNDKGEFEIGLVQKGSIAERSGFAKGDVIISIDGVKVSSVELLRLILSEKRWDDSAAFEVRKRVKADKGGPVAPGPLGSTSAMQPPSDR